MPEPEPMSVQTRQVSRPWQRESFNTHEQQSSPRNAELQNDSKMVENSFLELGQIEIGEKC